MKWRSRRNQQDPQDEGVRPRLGQITHPDGTETPIAFERVSDEEADACDGVEMFRPVQLDGEPVTLGRGDRLHVDVVGPRQGILVEQSPDDGNDP
jgi:hypothetical protein